MNKIFVFFLLFLLPVIIGMGMASGNDEEKRISNYYIKGVLFILFTICSVFWIGQNFQWTFTSQKIVFISVMLLGSLLAMGIAARKRTIWKIKPIKWYIMTAVILVIIFLILFQIQGYIYVSAFDQNDITVESVNTILANPLYYQINPYTGTSMELTNCTHEYSAMQLLYAILCEMTGLQSSKLVHGIIPFWTFITSAAIWYEFGMTLFKDRKRAATVVILVCVLNIFGAGQFWLNSEYLLFKAWRDEAIEAAIILPILVMQVCKANRARNWIVQIALILMTGVTAVLIYTAGSFYIMVLAIVVGLGWSAKQIYERIRLNKSGT